MRPLRLTLQGFCAYAGRQEIDFTELNSHRLFLIAGPTGAGKTSLLDALCFALFGESSGEERGPQHLRSHHADPALPTEVTLDFALGNAVWRIRRRPKWEKPKRGGGTTPVGGEAELCELRGEETGKPIERDAEVRAKVEELLGYRAAEFRQVVMLPQGRFRELLVAKPGDRQDILTRLFQTALYRRIEQRLAEDAKVAAQECQRLSDRRRTLLDQAGAPDHAAATGALEAQAVALAEAEARQETAAGAETVARLAAEAGRETARKLAEASTAVAEREALRAKQPAVAEAAAQLDAARRADRLRGEQAGFEAATARAGEALQAAASAEAAAQRAREELAQAEAALADAPAREAEAAAQQAEATRLTGLLEQAEKAAAASAAAEAAARAAQEAATRQAQAEAAATVRRQAAGAAAEALATREVVAAQRERHRFARDAAEAAARDLAALARAARAHAEAERAAGQTRGVLARTTGQADAARAARLAGAAALAADHAAHLARTLAEGEPCPVCGGTHHPAPARPAGGTLPDLTKLEEAEARATAALDTARVAAGEAETALRLAAQARDGLLLRLGEAASRPAEEAAAALRTAGAALAEAEAAEAALPRLRVAAETARAAAEAAAAEALQATTAAQARATEAATAAATRDAVLDALPSGLAAPDALRRAAGAAATDARTLAETLRRDREARASADAAATATTAEAARAAEAARSAVEMRALREAALLAACTAAGFMGIAGFQAALMAAEAQAILGGRIDRFRESLAAAEARAAAAEAATQNLAAPDLAALDHALEEAAAGHRAAIDSAAALRERLAAGRRLLGEVEAAERALATAEAAYALRQDLAELASGRNRQRLSLEGFVLRSLLDEALSAANRRLRGMLKGRYTIRRVEEPERANRAIGLDIEVLDEWSGAARPAGTLSGGEGFCASLALALGLADTVQAHAGARRIDALFVDEGFGTLDAEALETAMAVLSELQAHDRIVGIISHVAELRDWIPAKLEVTPGRRGSTAAFRIG